MMLALAGTAADDQLTPGGPDLARDTDFTTVSRSTKDGCGVVTGQTTVVQLFADEPTKRVDVSAIVAVRH